MSDNINAADLYHAKILWDFHLINEQLTPADFILALGSHDERVAERAANLYLDGFAPLLVTSGGLGKVTKNSWDIPEGAKFAEIATGMGVPLGQVMIEGKATNTGENILFTKELLRERGVGVQSGILVTKPYMSRRALAAAGKQWPEIRWQVASPLLSFESYPNEEVTTKKTINLMVGDLQRLKVYADQGFQIPQIIPDEVWTSFKYLRDAGYDEFVIPNA